ncbi:glycosyltransferase [Clostridium ganghwense]|nr:glycosyltransferase [Clostridium ganghwense]
MIVKNEEENLEKCINAAKKYVDEIIIVDTGSDDSTKEIAYKFTNYVYDFEWCNDFAKARNFSISKANNDWILVIDADEIITDFNKENVLNFIKHNDKVVGRIKRINPFEDVTGVKKYIERVNRLFNKNYFRYEGIIHEQIVLQDDRNYSIENIGISAEHIGYTQEVLNRTKKIERNINLLKKAILDKNDDPYLYYQLGKSYYMNKEYEEACSNFTKALKLPINFMYEYVEDLVESYGYSLINTNRFSEALILGDYEKYYKNSADYNFLMGLICMNNAKFDFAVEYFSKCMEGKEGRIEGVNTYLPNYNIGVIFECLGYKKEAVEFYKKCKGYKVAENRLKELV